LTPCRRGLDVELKRTPVVQAGLAVPTTTSRDYIPTKCRPQRELLTTDSTWHRRSTDRTPPELGRRAGPTGWTGPTALSTFSVQAPSD